MLVLPFVSVVLARVVSLTLSSVLPFLLFPSLWFPNFYCLDTHFFPLRYVAGFLALLYYARYVQNACDYLDVIHTVRRH